MFHLKNKKAKYIFSGGTTGQTYVTCKANPAKMTPCPPPCCMCCGGDFRRERLCHFLGALTSQEESLSVQYHKQTLVTCLYDAAPGNTLKTHSRQAQNCWNSLR